MKNLKIYLDKKLDKEVEDLIPLQIEKDLLHKEDQTDQDKILE
jgi:hypothetical protein